MQLLLNTWNGLDLRKRIVVILATLAVFAGVVSLMQIASSPRLTLLYSGLESSAAGDVVSALEQQGVIFEIRGGAIFVEADKRDALRMTLASEGLPANGVRGYELLDGLSGFGTTSQMFDAAYWRAKEGELARTIAGNPSIAMARVHISNTGANPFQRDVHQTASVTVTAAGGALSAAQARALKYLVASAVAGLEPEDVSVIDNARGLVNSQEDGTSGTSTDDRAAHLKDRVQRLLEARVGYGNTVVELSLETNMQTESIRERRFDPTSRVAISTETEENTNTAKGEAGGDVTVASNLPDQNAGGAGGSSSQNNQTKERINYEVSETEREITRAPGAVKRLTVAVLVNGDTQTAEEGTQTITPRSDDELAALKELVASAVGFDADRGDVITIKSMAFEPIITDGTPAGAAGFLDGLDLTSMLQLLVLALVTLGLGLFVVRPILMRPPDRALPALEPARPRARAMERRAVAPNDGEIPSLVGEIDDGDMPFPNLAAVNGDAGMMPTGGLPSADPVARLRSLISERQSETVEILRGWLDVKEGQNR